MYQQFQNFFLPAEIARMKVKVASCVRFLITLLMLPADFC